MQKKCETGNMGATASSMFSPEQLELSDKRHRWHSAYLQAARDLMDSPDPGPPEEVIAYATKIADGAIVGPK